MSARLLVHTAHAQAVGHAGPGFGRLLSPRDFSRVRDTAEAGIPWAADNDCFQGLDARLYKAMLRAVTRLPGCLFVTVPDVVEDAWATAERWAQWSPLVRLTGQPLALVAQDGLTVERCSWETFDVLFVGGSTDWKLGAEAAELIGAAKRRGIYVHMGRVNSRKRWRYASSMDVDSTDGTQFSMFRDTYLPGALTWRDQHLQKRMAI